MNSRRWLFVAACASALAVSGAPAGSSAPSGPVIGPAENFPNASPFDDRAAPSAYSLNDGLYTNGWGVSSPGEIVGVHAFEAVGGIDVLSSISCKWRTAVSNGTPARVFVWQDTGTGTFPGARLLHEQSITIQNSGTQIRNVYALSKGVVVSGRFYVGCAVPIAANQYPLATLAQAQAPGSVYVGATMPGPFNAASVNPSDFVDESSSWTLTLRAEGMNTGFTYQGRLSVESVNYTGSADLRFELFDAPIGGNSLGPVQELSGVAVSAGVFTVQVPQALSTFVNRPGNLWVEVSATTPSGNAAGWTHLTPRTPLAPAPMANAASVASKALSVDWSAVTNRPLGTSAWTAVSNGIVAPEAVGIGVGAPASPFHVRSSNQTNLALFDSDASAGTWVHFRNTGEGGRDWSLISSGPGNTEGAGKLMFFDGGAPTVRMTLDTGGNLGVGTTSPIARLHVEGGPSFYQFMVRTSDGGGTWAHLHNTGTGGRQWSLVSTGTANTEGAGSFLIRDSTAGLARLTIMPSGNVGINTSTPEKALTVNGTVQIMNGQALAFGTVGNGLGTAENTDLMALFRVNVASGLSQNVSELRLVIGDDNATNPNVYDSFIIGTNPGGGWNPTFHFRSDGFAFKPGGGSWAAISDPRAKHDVTPLTGTLDKLLTLRGYRFFYNDDIVGSGRGLAGPQIGLMADEVERIFPDWVTRDVNGLRSVSERATTALMVEALRDLRREKDEAVSRLTRENEELRARLERLEKKLEIAK
ncbi:MAG: tail fiber domain-containing protein [Planctomycetes bacterium]|nr:tail fiber domain-containing protein [Planctomycetota bacterium]